MQAADTSQSDTLEGEEFIEFYKALTKRIEVQELFGNFSADGQKLTLLEFVDFLQEEQKEGEHASDLALALIDRYEPSESGKRTRTERYHDQKGPEISSSLSNSRKAESTLTSVSAQSPSSHSATSQMSAAISICCLDKTSILCDARSLTRPLSSTMLMLHIIHLLEVLPDISFWPQWKYKTLGPLALVSSPLVHMIHFPLVPFMVPFMVPESQL